MSSQLSKLSILLLVGIVPIMAFASTTFNVLDLTNNKVKNLTGKMVQDPGTYQRGLREYHDDVYSDQNIKNVKLTPEQVHQAITWGLTKTEEKRYVILMKNRSGLYWKNKGLSPVEILGANARNPEERKHYALLYAKQLQERQAKELAWQFSASQAKAEVNKGLPLILPFDVSKFSPYNYHAITIKPGDQIFLLTRTGLNVNRIVSTLLSDIDKLKQVTLNIYFKNNPSSKIIQDWANEQNIPVSLVKDRIITINTDPGPFNKIKTISTDTLPMLVLVRNGQATEVSVSRF